MQIAVMRNSQDELKNVLIVDDERPFLLSLAAGLKTYSSDFRVLTAENGKEALEILESMSIDLVVTDLRMPEMDGIGLLTSMGRNFPAVPAIVVSAYGTRKIKNRLRTMRTLRFLEKPLNFQELAHAIIDGLKRNEKGAG